MFRSRGARFIRSLSYLLGDSPDIVREKFPIFYSPLIDDFSGFFWVIVVVIFFSVGLQVCKGLLNGGHRRLSTGIFNPVRFVGNYNPRNGNWSSLLFGLLYIYIYKNKKKNWIWLHRSLNFFFFWSWNVQFIIRLGFFSELRGQFMGLVLFHTVPVFSWMKNMYMVELGINTNQVH